MVRAAAIFLSLLACLPSLAPAAELIADLEPGQDGIIFEDIPSVLSLGDRAVFTLLEPSSGMELWVSDGTSAGTELLRDFCPGSCWSNPLPLGVIGKTALFLAGTEGVNDLPKGHLLRTDGTRPGTRVVTSEGPSACDSEVGSAVLGDAILFPGSIDASSCTLWRTDGTEAGTRPVAGVGPSLLTAAGGRAFFRAWKPDTGEGLWRSDGTAAGTTLVRSFPGGLVGFVAAGSDLLFLHLTESSSELWQSDGTEAGTIRIAVFADPQAFYANILRAARLGSQVIFAARDGFNGEKIWTTSGPAWQARPLSDCPGGCPRVAERTAVAEFGGRILFVATNSSFGADLWSTDGTGPGTHKVATVCDRLCSIWPQRIVPMLGQAFFLAGTDTGFSLWRTDGTTAGTVRLAGQRRDYANRDLRAAQAGNRIVFAGLDWNLGPEIWASDGTPEGTGPLTVLGATNSSLPTGFVALGDRVAFYTWDGHDRPLWVSGGTAASTIRLAEIQPLGKTSGIQAGGLLFFSSSDLELWRTDGSPSGTFKLPLGGGTVSDIVPFGAKAAVLVYDQGADSLWGSNGTPAGTGKLLDLPPGLSNVRHLTGLGAEVWFVGDGGGTGRLYRSDGTVTGTRPVTGSEHGLNFYYRPVLARLGAQTFFALAGNGLWRTDGTFVSSTARILEVPSSGDSEPVLDLVEHQGSLYLLGREGLWKSDGTAAGTVLLRAFHPNRAGTPSLTRLGAHLYFTADDGEHGLELWRTDGTTTVLVSDLVPGERSSNPRDLEAAGARLFFSAGTEEHGRELWESDGTEDGTNLVQDIAPGAQSSSSQELTAAGGKLFFAADDLLTGREPWVHSLSGAGCQADAETLCLGGGRFRVEATWRDFQGNEGRGKAVALTADTGYFWFFSPANVEVVLKVLDGQGVNGHRWVFYGALSTVEYTLTVTDTQTGVARRYVNPPGRLASVGDTHAFGPLGAQAPAVFEHEPVIRIARAAAAACVPAETRLCLQGGRFAVEARWTDFQGNQGVGKAVHLSGDTGYFWFFDAANVEVVLKVLDGRGLNDRFWVFYGALSSVDYTLTVTDTQTGQVRTYHNPPGRLASVADTGAF